MDGSLNSHMEKKKISIIEDSKIHIEWLKIELLEDKNLEVVSVDMFGNDGITSIRAQKPDMVILDFQLKDMTGLEVSRKIKNYEPNVKIFMLTALNEISIIRRLIEEKNIDAIAIKGSQYFEDNFLLAINNVLKGGSYLDPSLLGKLRESKDSSGLASLTKREFEVFIQSSIGKPDDEIARDLYVDAAHIKNLKSRITKKIKGDNISPLLLELIENSHVDSL